MHGAEAAMIFIRLLSGTELSGIYEYSYSIWPNLQCALPLHLHRGKVETRSLSRMIGSHNALLQFFKFWRFCAKVGPRKDTPPIICDRDMICNVHIFWFIFICIKMTYSCHPSVMQIGTTHKILQIFHGWYSQTLTRGGGEGDKQSVLIVPVRNINCRPSLHNWATSSVASRPARHFTTGHCTFWISLSLHGIATLLTCLKELLSRVFTCPQIFIIYYYYT